MRKIILFLVLISSISRAYTQIEKDEIIVSGRIVEETGKKPLGNVSISSVYASGRSTSDESGNFSLRVKQAGDTIYFSHLGYLKKSVLFKAGSPVNLRISMAQSGLELKDIEIVNTGFQKLPKERSTGSFAQIDSKLYNEQVSSSVIDRLGYITNGISPIAAERTPALANSKLLIRGMSTLTFSIQKPLIIVDNFEYQGSIDNLNPNDIESITVLKDAAAGSIWGAKAANGVIVINTKKGKFNSQLRIAANANFSVSEKPNLMDIPIISPSDLIDVEQFLFSQKYRFGDTARSSHPAFSPVYEILFSERAGKITAVQAKGQLDFLRSKDIRKEYSAHFYRPAIAQQYALNLSGGSDVLAWILSAGMDQNLGPTGAEGNRFTLRNSSSLKLGRHIDLNIDLNFSQNNTVSGRPTFGQIKPASSTLPSYTTFVDEQDNPIPIYMRYRQGFIDNFGSGKLLDWLYYPLEEFKHSLAKARTQDMNAAFGANYKLNSLIGLELRYRYERQSGTAESLNDERSYVSRDLVNSFSQINTSTGVVSYKVPPGGILDETFSDLTAQNLRFQVNANRDWNDHSVSFLAGSEVSEAAAVSSTGRTYGYRAEQLSFSNVDLMNPYPDIISGSNAFIPPGKNFTQTNNRFLSFFTNAAYSYKGRYTISGSVRRDASNLFGANTNNKWKPLWSIGAGWDITRENFFKQALFEKLKLRGSYGVQGNIDPTQVAVATFNFTTNNPYTLTPISQIANYPNPELRWEQVKMLNLGLDFTAKGGRISGSVEFYRKHLEDLFGNLPVDRTTGIAVGSLNRNIGEAKGRGLDVQVKGIIINSGLRWQSDLIFNTYNDKVTKLNEPPVLGAGVISTGFLNLQGYSTSALFSYKWAGLDPTNGDPMGYLNGSVSKDYAAIRNQTKLADIKYFGRSTPSVFGSFGNNFSYNDFSLSIRIIYKFGYFFRRESLKYSSLLTLNGHSDYALRWQRPGDELTTNVPSFAYPFVSARDDFYNNSEVLIEKGDQIRLQYVNLSYTVSKARHKSLPFQELSIYAVGSNLGLLWAANRKRLDPDYPSLRASKQYTLGFRINY